MRPPPPRRAILEDLEPRILYSADHPAALLAATLNPDAPNGAPAQQVALQSAPQQPAVANEIVFIDARVDDRDVLLADIAAQAAAGRQIEAIVLDAERDGITQIGDALAARGTRGTFGAVHLISHAAEGMALAGNTWLDETTLITRAGDIAGWGAHLAAGADLMLYGCDAGDGSDGAALVNGLAALTGANVAASDDATGVASRGGNWTLEVTNGAIEAKSAIDYSGQALWNHVLNTYVVTNAANGLNSLIAAISNANSNPGADLITFNLAGTGIHTVAAGLNLPSITGTVTIDATTDDSFAANGNRPAIVLSGGGTLVTGFRLFAGSDGSTIRGFVINGFTGNAIEINASSGNTIVGNWVGLNTAGTAAFANGGNGINIVNAASNVIGGSASADGNVISGNTGNGIIVSGESSDNNVIRGNRIGVNVAGTGTIANADDGIEITGGADGTVIGGTGAGEGNWIAGNTWHGINVTSTGTGTSGTVIQGNRIGTDLTGSLNWGNGRAGISLDTGTSGTQIGGTATAAGNIIAFSGQLSGSDNDGVVVIGTTSTGNSILGNAIYGNVGQAIDLGNDGVTANDVGDADTGANDLQNFPVLSAATTTGSNTTITGTLTSAANTSYRIEFFCNEPAYADTNGEGQVFLGAVSVTTDGSGVAAISALLATILTSGDRISATATDASGNTSECAANVTAVLNNAPVGTANTVTTNEDTPLTFAAADFGFTDADGGDSLSAVRIDTLPGVGSLTLSGVAVTAGQVITTANIGNLVFTPVANANGAGYAGFTFSVRDQVDAFDVAPKAMTIDVTPVNDAPVGTANTVTTNEDTPLTFGAADFGLTDIDAGDSLSAVRIDTLPGAGALTLSGVAVTAGQVITAANIGNLVFTPGANANGAGYAGFTFSVRDQGGAYDSAPKTMTVNVTAVNDTPVGTANTVITNEDTPLTFAAADFGFTDVDSGDSLSAVRIDTLPGAGALTLSGVAVTAGQVITAANLGNLVFTPAANATGAGYASFTFSVRDQASAYDAGPKTMTVNVTAVNDAPVGTANTVTTNEDTPLTFGATDFGFTDVDAGDSLSAVRIDTLPGVGSLTLSGVAVIAGQVITAANLGNLVFTPAANAAGAGYASFTFSVRDQASAYDAAPKAMTINVTAVNDAPVGTANAVTTNEDTPLTFAAADFGFTDVDAGDSLSAVRIDTLPGAGSLTLSGVAVTAGQVITTANIGNLVFTPVANANGAGYAGFTFSVRDQSGAYDAAPKAMTVNVTAVNDAPVGTANTVTTNEDTPLTFGAGDFGFTDVDAGDSLSAVRIDTLPGAGSLTLSGVAVTAGQVITAANIGNLVFTPALNANGAGYAGFTFSVRDQASAYDAAPKAMTVNVTAVNDAPVGTANTVTTNEDTPVTFGAGDFGFTDVDAGDSLSAVRIDTLPGAGSLTLSGVAVTAGQVITTANIGNLVFTPVANANGAGYAGFTFSVRDQSGAYDAAPKAMTINVTAVNDAPVGTANTVTTNEDTPLTFAAGDFGFSDVDAGDSLSAVRIDTLPGVGTFTLSGVAVTAGQVITAANIGNLVFTPALNANGAGYAGFTFSVRDQGGVYDAAPKTMTVNVTAVNDAPVGTANTVTTNEDTPVTFAAGDFGFSDVDAGDSLSAVRIDTLPGAGTFTLSGVAVTAGQVITAANIGNLVFTPVANANGAGYAGFAFSVRDQGSTHDAAPKAMTINVTAVNDAPVGTANTVTTNEDTPLTFAAGDFGFTDIDAGDSLSAVRIDTLPGAGTLTLSGVAVTAGQVITTANIGNLVFTPALNANGAGYAGFTFSGRDQVNAFDATPKAMTINVTAVNDAPVGTANTVTTNEDTPLTFAAADFGFTDVDAGDSLSAVRIDTLPGAGALTLSGVAVTAGQVITAANIGNLVFTPALNANGAGYAGFTFSVPDQAGVYDPAPKAMTVNVTAVNDAPVGTANTVTTNEDTPLTFAAADFGFTDVDAGDSLSAVRIDTLPAVGTFTLSGVAVTAGQVITAANIGNLVFTPVANANCASYAGFTFSVRDQGAVYDAAPKAMTINVTAVNDAPVGTANTVTTNEDTPLTFAAADFGFTDVDAGDSLSAVRIDTLPAVGTFTLSGVAVTAGQVITAANIGNLVFTPAANANGAGYASFTFSVRDQASAFDAAPKAMTINVTAVNDAPVGTANTITTNEDTPLTFGAGDFGFTDVDVGDSLSAVRIDTLPGAGTLTLSGVAATAGQVITAANIGNLVFIPALNANGAGYASFTFSVRDQASAYDAAPKAMTINVAAVNDLPVGTSSTVTTNEDTSLTFGAADFGFTDVDAGDSLSAVRIDTLPGAGTFTLSGVAVTAGQVITIANIGNLVFTPAANANGAGYASFTFSVRDQTNAFDATSKTMTVNVTAVNDAPVGTVNTVTTNEDTPLTFGAADFGFTDVDAGDSLGAVRIDTLPGAGTFTLSGVAVTASQVITAANLGNLVFTPAANATGAGYAGFTFSVRDQASAYDAAPRAMTVNVTAVNDAPIGTNNTVTTDEDTPLTFAAADFGFTDIDAGDSLSAVRIDTLPGAGTFTLSGVAVTAGQVITTANIGNLVFTPALNANGASYAGFTFSVRDQAGAYDATPKTMTVDVTAVNDAPAGTANTVTTNEDTPLTFAAAHFGFSDIDAGDSLSAVRIDTLPGAGSLTLSGVAVTAGQVITAANLGNLVFTPAANATGAGYAGFTFSVRDQASAYDAAPKAMTINVTAVNDAPVGTSSTVTTNEDTPLTFGAADFGFTDVDAGDSLSAVRIDTLAGAGSLTLSGVAVTAGQVITTANLGNLVFTPALNANGAGYAGFTFSVRDQAGTYDAAPKAMTINVTAVNDAPVGTASTVTTIEDNGWPFASGDFGFTDVDAGDSMSALRIDTLPGAGTLTLSGVAVTAGQVITTANNSNLVFTPAADANGAGYAGFTFSVRDQAGAYDAAPKAMTMNVTAVSDAPVGTSNTVTTNEDTPLTFAAADFGFTDADVGDSLSAVRIDTVPGAGTLSLSGVAVSAGQVITAASIGSLVFTPATNANGAGYTGFTFSVRDPSGAYDAAPKAMTVNVTAVNDAPVGTANTVTTTEDALFTFAAGNFGFTDINAGDSLSAVRIDTLPGAGTLTLSGVAVTAGQVVTVANLGNLVFTPAADANGTGYASFSFSVRDQAGAFDAAPKTMTIDVTAVSDAPVGTANTVTTNEDTPMTFGAADFGFTDTDPGDSLSAVRIDTLPGAGSLTLSGLAVTAGQVITTANLGNLVFTPALNANGAGFAGFAFSVRDQGGAYDSAPKAMTINVTAVNDTPAGAANTVSANEDTPWPFAAADFGFTDIDAGDSLSAVRIDTLPGAGSLTLSGVAVTAGQVITAANLGNLVFTPAADASGSGYASFSFSVRDQAGAADPAPKTLVIDVAAVNDAPMIASDGGGATAARAVDENTTLVTTVAATDRDASLVSYTIVGGADAARFIIDPATGLLRFVTAPDFEAPADADGNNVYQVIVRASDGNLADTQTISVSVLPVNDIAPVIGNNGGVASAQLTVPGGALQVAARRGRRRCAGPDARLHHRRRCRCGAFHAQRCGRAELRLDRRRRAGTERRG